MLKPFLRLCSLALSLSTLAACAGGGGTGENLTANTEPTSCEVSGHSFGIVGGKTLGSGNELSSSTVMVVHIDDDKKESVCTGTLIDDDKVLTAAHCTQRFAGTTVIAFSNNVDCVLNAPKRTLRMVVQRAIPDDYIYSKNTSWTNSSYDLAILKFRGGLAPGYKVRELPSAGFQINAADTLVMAGYGVTNENTKDSGLLRFTTASGERISDRFHLALANHVIKIPQTLVLEQQDNGVCKGDSGGPLYAKTPQGLVLVGITSMGVDHRTKDEKNSRVCHGVGIFTDLRDNLPWIREQLEALKL
ncbi:MAG: protease [Bdellovibrio sp. ArHS]|uniref:S1 family peptidase n=1 Tax=Bdellovibrio sp. ArHS TaxID=1569284 RepID=UPI000582AD0C|nr:trypsin-like serine protease [Bdellovibrio sp. ArHS]KHD87783.1 MAG: protease [Bdellovibrio sp. ArHS]